jgi:RHS repeat-associated protein
MWQGQVDWVRGSDVEKATATSDYSYDSLGRLTGISDQQGDTVLASYAYTYGESAPPVASAPTGWQPGTSALGMPISPSFAPGISNPQSLIPNSQSPIPSLPSGVLLPFHDPSTINLAGLDQGVPAADQIASVTSADGTAQYSYDAQGELTGATYTGTAPQPGESYSYDANGNRAGTGYVIGADNELLCDGTYTYTYDAEGNRTAKFIDTNADGVLDSGDTNVTIYGWDNRNRLVSVTSYATYGDAPTQTVTYSYDAENRWIGETVVNGDGSIHRTAFAYDPEAGGGRVGAGQIVLQFDGGLSQVSSDETGTVPLTAANLSHRYLWGPAVDQILADEQLSPLPPGEGQGEGFDLSQPGSVAWPLTDNLGTVRDLAVYNAATGVTSVANHRVYDSFGNLQSQTNAAVDCLFGFTGRPLDPAGTGLQNNGNRWYDAATGAWLSQDPKGLSAGDTNLYRYCGNSPTCATDPSGESWNPWNPDFWNFWWPGKLPAPAPPPAPPVAPELPPLAPLLPGGEPLSVLEMAPGMARAAILASYKNRYLEACRNYGESSREALEALQEWQNACHKFED